MPAFVLCPLQSGYAITLFFRYLFSYKGFHLWECGLYTFCQFKLVAASHEVVLRILAVEINVAVDVVCDEAYQSHVGEQRCCKRKILDFYRCYETCGTFEITFCKGLTPFFSNYCQNLDDYIFNKFIQEWSAMIGRLVMISCIFFFFR